MLASCDRESAGGRRDYAILLVIARLALRGGEVAGLDLGDVDWRAAEVTVRGKGNRADVLPLPADVGEAERPDLAPVAGHRWRGHPRVGRRVEMSHVDLRALQCAALVRGPGDVQGARDVGELRIAVRDGDGNRCPHRLPGRAGQSVDDI